MIAWATYQVSPLENKHTHAYKHTNTHIIVTTKDICSQIQQINGPIHKVYTLIFLKMASRLPTLNIIDRLIIAEYGHDQTVDCIICRFRYGLIATKEIKL